MAITRSDDDDPDELVESNDSEFNFTEIDDEFDDLLLLDQSDADIECPNCGFDLQDDYDAYFACPLCGNPI